jgi:Ca2+-binding RTX toxin-like protein
VARERKALRARTGVFAGAAMAALLAFPGVASATVTKEVAGGVLTVKSDADDAISIACVGGNVQVNGEGFTPDVLCNTINSIVVQGGPGANVISLAGVAGAAFPILTTVTIDGGGGNDTITGSDRADVIDGGADNDRIIGDNNPDGTFDDSRGGAGEDTLVWNPGDGSDINVGGDGTDTIEVNGGGGNEKFSANAAGGGVRFERSADSAGGFFSLDITTSERLDLNANNGDDSFTSDGAIAALGFALDVDGGGNNDTLDGGDGPDKLDGGDGNDRVIGDNNADGTFDESRGGAGEDTLVWNPGDGSDINDGGAGTDTIEVNGGGTEKFSVKPAATGGGVRFERSADSQGGFFSLDITTSERLDMNAGNLVDSFTAADGLAALGFALDVDGGADDDNLEGGDGADLIEGGDGDDTITGDDNPDGTEDVSRGGLGDDTMIWDPGDDSDINEGGEGNDTSVVNGATGDEKFDVRPSATAGRVDLDRTDPAPFSVDIGTTENLLVNAGAGNDRIRGFEGLAGLIKSTFNGDDGNDAIRGTDGEDALGGGKGHDFINSVDKAADAVECGNGIDLALIDRRDTIRACELAIGGRLQVLMPGKPKLDGDTVAIKLHCIANKRCKSKVVLRHDGHRIGKKKLVRIADGKKKTVRVKLNKRGLRALAGDTDGKLKIKVRVDTKDKKGNGWRTAKRATLSH